MFISRFRNLWVTALNQESKSAKKSALMLFQVAVVEFEVIAFPVISSSSMFKEYLIFIVSSWP